MKIKIFLRASKIFLLILIVGFVKACVKNDDFSLPDTELNPREIEGDTIDIPTLKSLFAQEAGYFGSLSGDEQFTFKETELFLVGYVISSDETGNFYQELILQDQSSNPTSGIKVLLQVDPLYIKFEIGRKIYVELDEFTVGFSNGVIALGVPQAGTDYLDKAPRVFEDKIYRTLQKDSIIPLPIDLPDVLNHEDENKYDNLFVEVKNMQFVEDLFQRESKPTFAAGAEDFYDALRNLESCENNSQIPLVTSTFSDFKTLTLPNKNGYLIGVLTKTFDGKNQALKLNYPSDINFNKERCEPNSSGEDDNTSDPGESDLGSDPQINENAEPAFAGGKLDNWSAFIEGLSSSGLQDYAKKSKESGIENGNSLYLYTTAETTNNNDYVFIASANSMLPTNYRRISFYMKGTAEKSISINLYKPDGDYYRFNLKNISGNTSIQPSGSNQYSGKIDTNDKWVLISLDLSRIDDLNIGDSSSDFFALKIGKNASYNLYFDQFTIE